MALSSSSPSLSSSLSFSTTALTNSTLTLLILLISLLVHSSFAVPSSPSLTSSSSSNSLASFVAHDDAQLDEFPTEIPLYDPSFPSVNNGSGSTSSSAAPVSAIHFLGTWLFVGLSSGVLYQVDIRTGEVQLLDPGIGRQFGGLCLDSREPKTLYATGRDSGEVYAFDVTGRHVRTYAVARPGEAFLAQCIQSQYQLIITDSISSNVYVLPLSDENKIRGLPSNPKPRDDDSGLVGEKVQLTGDWFVKNDAKINMYGVEWTQNFNRTVFFVLNSATGALYSVPVSEEGIPGELTARVNVTGQITTFVGGAGILFEPSDESVLYITMPHWNAIAVLELEDDLHARVKRAKFIKLIKNLSLANLPIALGEYGDFLYICSMLRAAGNSVHTLIRTGRYWSRKNGQTFSTTFDNVTFTPDTYVSTGEVQGNLTQPTAYDDDDIGYVDVESVPRQSHSFAPSPVPYRYTPPTDDEGAGSDSNTSPSLSPSVPPVSVAEDEAPPQNNSEGDGGEEQQKEPPSVFENDDGSGSGNDKPTGLSSNTGSCFPGSATVRVRGGAVKSMRELQLGDEVLTGSRRYAKVFMFSHRNNNVLSRFVTLTVHNNLSVSLTPGHYIPTANGITGAGELDLKTANEVQVGDVLLLWNGRREKVTKKEFCSMRGLYNPHVMGDGDGNGDDEWIVVDGVVATSFTTAIDRVKVAALLAPLRVVCKIGLQWPSRTVTDWLVDGVDRWVLDAFAFGTS